MIAPLRKPVARQIPSAGSVSSGASSYLLLRVAPAGLGKLKCMWLMQNVALVHRLIDAGNQDVFQFDFAVLDALALAIG